MNNLYKDKRTSVIINVSYGEKDSGLKNKRPSIIISDLLKLVSEVVPLLLIRSEMSQEQVDGKPHITRFVLMNDFNFTSMLNIDSYYSALFRS